MCIRDSYSHIFTLGFLSAIQEILLLLMTISTKSQNTIKYRTQGHQPKVFIHPAQDYEMLNIPLFPMDSLFLKSKRAACTNQRKTTVNLNLIFNIFFGSPFPNCITHLVQNIRVRNPGHTTRRRVILCPNTRRQPRNIFI